NAPFRPTVHTSAVGRTAAEGPPPAGVTRLTASAVRRLPPAEYGKSPRLDDAAAASVTAAWSHDIHDSHPSCRRPPRDPGGPAQTQLPSAQDRAGGNPGRTQAPV